MSVCVCGRENERQTERETEMLHPNPGGVCSPLAGMTNHKTRIPALCFQPLSARVKAKESRRVKQRDGERMRDSERAREMGGGEPGGGEASESEFESSLRFV